MKYTHSQIYRMRADIAEFLNRRYTHDVYNEETEVIKKTIEAYNPNGESGMWICTGEEEYKIQCVDEHGQRYIFIVKNTSGIVDAKMTIFHRFGGCVYFYNKYGNAFNFVDI